jgi:diguanylate cyclase (GGDEF)-like protein
MWWFAWTRGRDFHAGGHRHGSVTAERQLSAVLSEFARTMVTDFPIQGILERLVQRIVEILPVTGAGVTLISPNSRPRYVAASNQSALRYEQLQTELGEGPCLAVYRTGEAVAVADLRTDERFKIFGTRAAEVGLVAVFTFPLRQGDKQLGALDLYRDEPGLLDSRDMETAQTLADVTAAYLVNAQTRADLQDSSERSYKNSIHDALTGLPNRVLLLERLEQALKRHHRSAKTVAVLFADLDRFKTVNDMYGHHVGDNLLVAVAERLTALVRPGDTLARISGDEFVVLCEDLDDEAQAKMIAMRVVDAVALPFDLAGVTVEISASVGIACTGLGENVPEQMLHDADTAMYQAKHKGGNDHQVVDWREQARAQHQVSLQRDLRGVISRGELRLDYQPIVHTDDGRMVAAEALLRWDHPDRGIIPPMTLVPLAEQGGLIAEIGRWVLQQACADRLRWTRETGSDDIGINVNVSAHQLMGRGFVATVGSVLADSHTRPDLLTLEITESVFVQDAERALVVLRELKRLGVKLALDDFGTGYSSLSYLQRFPVDFVKIDQWFIADLAQNAASYAIVSTVIALAHKLGLGVVSEGVETAEQHREVADLGSDSCQGFYFSLPVPADQFLYATAATTRKAR